MPKLAVQSAFNKRGWTITNPTPEQCFIIAQEFGVGFTALITHLSINLEELSLAKAEVLKKSSLATLRRNVTGFDVTQDCFVVDKYWSRSSVEIETGDILILPEGASSGGPCLEMVTVPKNHLIAVAPGSCSITFDDAPKEFKVRVSRKGFIGHAKFRHLEEAEDDE